MKSPKHYWAHGSHVTKAFVGKWRKNFRDYVDLCLTSGFIPRALRPLQLVGKYLAKIWVYVQVGRVRVIGKKNLVAPAGSSFAPTTARCLMLPSSSRSCAACRGT